MECCKCCEECGGRMVLEEVVISSAPKMTESPFALPDTPAPEGLSASLRGTFAEIIVNGSLQPPLHLSWVHPYLRDIPAPQRAAYVRAAFPFHDGDVELSKKDRAVLTRHLTTLVRFREDCGRVVFRLDDVREHLPVSHEAPRYNAVSRYYAIAFRAIARASNEDNPKVVSVPALKQELSKLLPTPALVADFVAAITEPFGPLALIHFYGAGRGLSEWTDCCVLPDYELGTHEGIVPCPFDGQFSNAAAAAHGALYESVVGSLCRAFLAVWADQSYEPIDEVTHIMAGIQRVFGGAATVLPLFMGDNSDDLGRYLMPCLLGWNFLTLHDGKVAPPAPAKWPSAWPVPKPGVKPSAFTLDSSLPKEKKEVSPLPPPISVSDNRTLQKTTSPPVATRKEVSKKNITPPQPKTSKTPPPQSKKSPPPASPPRPLSVAMAAMAEALLRSAMKNNSVLLKTDLFAALRADRADATDTALKKAWKENVAQKTLSLEEVSGGRVVVHVAAVEGPILTAKERAAAEAKAALEAKRAADEAKKKDAAAKAKKSPPTKSPTLAGAPPSHHHSSRDITDELLCSPLIPPSSRLSLSVRSLHMYLLRRLHLFGLGPRVWEKDVILDRNTAPAHLRAGMMEGIVKAGVLQLVGDQYRFGALGRSTSAVIGILANDAERATALHSVQAYVSAAIRAYAVGHLKYAGEIPFRHFQALLRTIVGNEDTAAQIANETVRQHSPLQLFHKGTPGAGAPLTVLARNDTVRALCATTASYGDTCGLVVAFAHALLGSWVGNLPRTEDVVNTLVALHPLMKVDDHWRTVCVRAVLPSSDSNALPLLPILNGAIRRGGDRHIKVVTTDWPGLVPTRPSPGGVVHHHAPIPPIDSSSDEEDDDEEDDEGSDEYEESDSGDYSEEYDDEEVEDDEGGDEEEAEDDDFSVSYGDSIEGDHSRSFHDVDEEYEEGESGADSQTNTSAEGDEEEDMPHPIIAVYRTLCSHWIAATKIGDAVLPEPSRRTIGSLVDVSGVPRAVVVQGLARLCDAGWAARAGMDATGAEVFTAAEWTDPRFVAGLVQAWAAAAREENTPEPERSAVLDRFVAAHGPHAALLELQQYLVRRCVADGTLMQRQHTPGGTVYLSLGPAAVAPRQPQQQPQQMSPLYHLQSLQQQQQHMSQQHPQQPYYPPQQQQGAPQHMDPTMLGPSGYSYPQTSSTTAPSPVVGSTFVSPMTTAAPATAVHTPSAVSGPVLRGVKQRPAQQVPLAPVTAAEAASGSSRDPAIEAFFSV